MTIRRLDKTDNLIAKPGVGGKRRTGEISGGENFARFLDSLSGTRESDAVFEVGQLDEVEGVGGEPSHSERRQQLQQTDEMLGSLESLEQDLQSGGRAETPSRERLQETRDQALHTLSGSPKKGEERDLLHRTAVLATVELAKTDRGDYK
ncbi:MAG: hypothetical protein HQL56_09500 [Magnetococcales bacterium]|nr:hypothetical protein [Magnetococcales bacterium]